MSKRYKRLLSVIISIVLLAGIATAVGAVDIFSLKNSEQAGNGIGFGYYHLQCV